MYMQIITFLWKAKNLGGWVTIGYITLIREGCLRRIKRSTTSIHSTPTIKTWVIYAVINVTTSGQLM